MTLPCTLHVHSTYSDGEYSLAELREVFLRAGKRAVCLADHAEYFDAARVQQYISECAQYSDATLRLIPGLEFGCEDRMHIVGYGVTALTDRSDPESVIAHIHAHNGISVIAHPRDDHFGRIQSLAILPSGIEAWNTKYDGRYAPRPQTFELIERLRERNPDLLAFYGLDLHWKTQFRGLEITVRAATNARSDVLAALAQGNFNARKGRVVLSSRVTPQRAQLRRFGAWNSASHTMWRALKAVKSAAGGLGNRLPAPIKAQLRRIF